MLQKVSRPNHHYAMCGHRRALLASIAMWSLSEDLNCRSASLRQHASRVVNTCDCGVTYYWQHCRHPTRLKRPSW